MIPERLIFIDLETTGMSPLRNRIIEVGLCETYRGEVVSEWSSLVNPGGPLPPFIQQLTGITSPMVASAPSFAQIADDLHARLSDAILVAHNARFDSSFLRSEFERLGIDFQPTMLCTVKLSRKLFPHHSRHSLDSIIERHGLIRPADRHRALADVQLTWQFYAKLLREIPETSLGAAIQEQLKRPSLPAHLPKEQIDALPCSPGVYIMYGEEGAALYVGKSVDLKSRVLSHFTKGNREHKGMRLSQQVHQIEWIETAGELGALLLESELIKKLAPIHNRRLRRVRDLFTLALAPDPADSRISITSLNSLRGADLARIYGVFRSKRQAEQTLRELAREEELCVQVMGLEKGTGGCFNLQLKRCRGACIGKEDLRLHKLRLAQALTKLKLQDWPYRGAIGIREAAADGSRTDIHLFHHWCHLGTACDEEQLWAMLESPEPQYFDLDSYKLLTGYLKKHKTGIREFPT